MVLRKEVKNRLQAKLRERQKGEMEAVKKREILETFAAKNGIVPAAAAADSTKGDMHPVRLKLGYGPDGHPSSATLEIEVPEEDTTVADFLAREHVQSMTVSSSADIAKAHEDGLSVKFLEAEGVQITVSSSADIDEAAMKQIFETIKSKQLPGIDRFFRSEDPEDLAKRLSSSVPIRIKPGFSFGEKVTKNKAKIDKKHKIEEKSVENKNLEQELNKEKDRRESEMMKIASMVDLNNAPVSPAQPTTELIEKAPKKKNKKVSPSMSVRICEKCGNPVEESDREEEKKRKKKKAATKEKAKEELGKSRKREPSAVEEN